MSGRATMRAWGVALALAGLTAPPLSAQPATTNAVTPAPAPAPAPGTIGPGELRDFSLPGTVTRPTDTPPAVTTSPGIRRTETQPTGAEPLPVRSRPVASPAPSRSVTVALPAPDPLAREPTLAPSVDGASADIVSRPPVPSVAPPPASLAGGETDGSWLPWLFALLLAAGGAAAFLWRQRRARRPAYAGARVEERAATPAAAPASAPVFQPVPVSTPAPAPPAPRADGIVSARLRPWIEIEFDATRAVVTADAATVHFDIILTNSGSAPARDVRVEGRMFNAGPEQDRELGVFFERPAPQVDAIPEIAPLSRIELKSTVTLPRADLREYEVEGRKLFVPILGFNAHYRFGGGPAQTSASFIVGRGGDDGGKMAPIRLDLGPRVFRGLSQRQHNVGVRA